MVTVPQWGIWLMFISSLTGAYLLGRQLSSTGWRFP